MTATTFNDVDPVSESTEWANWKDAPAGDESIAASSALSELAIGAVAGLRASLPLAALMWSARSGGLSAVDGLSSTLRSRLAHPWSLAVSTLLAAGELTADKLPSTPARIAPGPLGGRAVSGALSGAALARGAHRSSVRGALYGAVGAIAASFGGYYLRRALTRRLAPDLVVALVEDAAAVGIAAYAVSRTRSRARATSTSA